MMSREEAEALAAKREQHKPKSMLHKRWAAVHTSTKGWHVALVDNHAHIEATAKEKASRALRSGNMTEFVEAASDALLAMCAQAVEAVPSDRGSRPVGPRPLAGVVHESPGSRSEIAQTEPPTVPTGEREGE